MAQTRTSHHICPPSFFRTLGKHGKDGQLAGQMVQLRMSDGGLELVRAVRQRIDSSLPHPSAGQIDRPPNF